MRRRGALLGSWVERLASVTAISTTSFEQGRSDPPSGAQTLPREIPHAHGGLDARGRAFPCAKQMPRVTPARGYRSFRTTSWSPHSAPAGRLLQLGSGIACNSRCRNQAPESARLSHFGNLTTATKHANICSHRFRPEAVLFYEHMFCSSSKPEVPARLARTLQLMRSFLLLEDDYDVDWEVDQDEWSESAPCTRESSCYRRDIPRATHPHRMSLRSRLGSRRPGIVAPEEQICLCPVGGRVRAGVSRGSFSPERSCADVPRGVGSSRNP
jgi:hypothetical protein